jgi:hypothetical protein
LAEGLHSATVFGNLEVETNPAPENADRRRRWGGLLVLGLVLLGLVLYQRSRSTYLPLHLHLGPSSAEMAHIELLWQTSTDGAVMLDFSYSFAGSPASSDLYRKVRLSPGMYDVAIRVTERSGHEWSTSQRVEVAPDRVLEIDLAAAAARRPPYPPPLPSTTR